MGVPVITLSACGEITKGGKYVVTSDLRSANDKPCLNIHDATDVRVNCGQHALVGDPAVGLKNVSGLSIEGCTVDAIETGFRMMEGSSVTNATFTNNVFGTEILSAGRTHIATVRIDTGSNISFSKNLVYGAFDLYTLSSTSITDNTFSLGHALSETTSPFIAANININNGHGNKIIGNSINGGSDGIYRGISNVIGADDGISFDSQVDLTVERNMISNVWDCGIEGSGDLINGKISSNTIKNAGVCGIGAWYDSSIEHSTFSDNTVDDSPKMFEFYWKKAVKDQTTIFFRDNTFQNNKIINPRLNKASGAYDGDMFNFTGIKNLIATNNIFIGNDFSTVTEPPYMNPSTLAVDGGGNVCKDLGPRFSKFNNPLKCGQ